MLTQTSASKVIASTLAAAALALTGCQTYTQQSADFQTAWKTGQIQTATAEIQKKAQSHADDKDTIVWALEEATVLRTAALANIAPPPPAAPATGAAPAPVEAPKPHDIQMIEKSNASFERAHAKIVKYEEEAKTKVASEAGAALTNLANLPYRGRALDKVMMHTYLAANYIKAGAPDKARVELNRVLQAQRDAVEANAKKIAAAQEEAQKAKKGKGAYDTDRALSDPKTATSLNGMETETNALVKGYEAYVNPFSVFLDGIFFGANAEGSSDFERARKSLQRVAAMSPDNAYAKQDLAVAEELHLGKSFDGTTYVIFETGSAPALEQWRLDLPIFAVTNRVSYVGAALPRIKTNPVFVESCTVTANGENYPTALVSSMDSVVAQEFKNEWPAVLTRTIVSVAVKATLDAAIQNQVKDQSLGIQLLAKGLTLAAQASTNIADLRSWTTLPKQFQYCRFTTPADGVLKVQVGTSVQEVKLEPGKVNLVWVRNVAPGAPTYISQSILKS
ncbi:COG3014 family protein [Nibricoccus sp. IMCC34717]|uniref:COG3014 family protein n=1 Tax=Nibricoccus sp. IMCC34717 TaxID=3034021 RepID=UPI00384F9AB5